MGILQGLGLRFRETMAGYLGINAVEPVSGAEQGKEEDTPFRFDTNIIIDDLESFLSVSEHEARLEGTVTFAPLGGTYEMEDGRFNLFSVDPETGTRRMVYRFRFTAHDGHTYYLEGHKEFRDDPGLFDAVEDITRLFTLVHRGTSAQAPVYGAGELYFDLSDAPELVSSIEVIGEASFWQKIAARLAFASFAYGALRTVYLDSVRLLYECRYENLVISGEADGPGGTIPFFLVSGEHEEGFPWGDGETFWDVLLILGDGMGGWERYCITDRVLQGLDLDIAARTYRYQGPLFRLKQGFSASFGQMRAEADNLEKCNADLELRFSTVPHKPVHYPFPVLRSLARRLTAPLYDALQQILPSEHPLGVSIKPHSVEVESGRLEIRLPDGTKEYTISGERASGEAEQGAFQNPKEPTLLYGYLCALDPGKQATRIQIHTRTLRNEREDWVKDRLDAFLGEVLSRKASGEIVLRPDAEREVNSLDPREDPGAPARLLKIVGVPLLEVNNDHYPTADFLRRIIRVRDSAYLEYLALEENMRQMKLGSLNSSDRTTVVSIRGEDRFEALDNVLNQARFEEALERRRDWCGRARDKFRIVIKPNFMFAYSRHDPTTFTDPELVQHLARRLRAQGYTDIMLVEAHSTYGEYFHKRRVLEMADYLGFTDDSLYGIVDLTEEAEGSPYFGPHLGEHPVPPTWRDADFRISFAKNKTHAYSYYTLTLKNVYGSLPLANKFKEYHCERDIYNTTMEWLEAFPVHFGLIDAWLSADGPFGVFADTAPNETRTIIGGENLVAVDWIGAGKMGIDPELSMYTRLAVEKFGKPRIDLVGDGGPYHPWLNVPSAITLFTHHGLDTDYHFGNLIYAGAAQMDETHFPPKKAGPLVKILRTMTTPLRRTFFVRTGKDPTWLNRMAARTLYYLGF